MSDVLLRDPAHGITVTAARTVADRQTGEATLARAGIELPLPQRQLWLEGQTDVQQVLLVAHDDHQVPRGAATVTLLRSRSLPGHRLHRVERLAGFGAPEYDRALVRAIALSAERDPFCLRSTVELFSRDETQRRALGASLQELGYARTPRAREYDRTLVLSLEPDEDALFARLSASARKNVRQPAKKGLELRPIEDTQWGPRMQGLLEETFSRTGGDAPQHDWTHIIGVSARHPQLSRIVGLFDPATPGPESLLSFAWSRRHADYATYDLSGSTRARRDLKNVPFLYAPLWELIVWARRSGATWFDFGGVTEGHLDSATDTLGGISDFKRYFSNEVVNVGEDWVRVVRPFRSRLAQVVGRAARWASRVSASR